jgi:hypothetical protein
MRSRFLLSVAAIGAVLGAVAGSASANPNYNNGVQTPLPVVRPAAAAFTLPLAIVQPALPAPQWMLGNVAIGRDDLSPWAGFQIGWPVGTPGTAGFPQAGGFFIYRPLWDPATVNLPAAPVTNVDFLSHWTAVRIAYDVFLQLRVAAAAPAMPGIIVTLWLWCDPTAVVLPRKKKISTASTTPTMPMVLYWRAR